MVKQMETYFLFPLLQRLHRKMRTISTHTQAQMAYEPTLWAKIFHSAPHVNITFHHVDPTFNPENDLYLESLGILASVPAGNFIFSVIFVSFFKGQGYFRPFLDLLMLIWGHLKTI